MKLVVVMGVTWVADVISWAVGGPNYLWYVTDLINALQGVFIFIVVGCQPQVRFFYSIIFCFSFRTFLFRFFALVYTRPTMLFIWLSVTTTRDDNKVKMRTFKMHISTAFITHRQNNNENVRLLFNVVFIWSTENNNNIQFLLLTLIILV